MVYGSFMVQKTDGGYFETPITVKNKVPWLNVSGDRIISSDFNEANAAMVKFSIDPLKVEGRYGRESVVIGHETGQDATNEVDIVFRRMTPLLLRLDREAYRFEDKGMVEVINNTGIDLLVELFCKESYVRFTARKFYVGERNGIPFDILSSAPSWPRSLCSGNFPF
jgi:hypothetical protein